MRKIALILAVLLPVAALVAFSMWPKQPVKAGAAGPEIVLYWGENFTGRSVTLTGTTFDLPTGRYPDTGALYDWNDQVRSILVVRGTWRLYQHGRANTRLDDTAIELFDVRQKLPEEGWSTLVSATSVGPLALPSPRDGGFAVDISSVELISAENLPDWAFSFRK